MSCDEGNQFFWMDTEQHFQKAIRTFHVPKKNAFFPPSTPRATLCVHYVFVQQHVVPCRISIFRCGCYACCLGLFHHQNLTELDAIVPKKMRRVVG